MLASLLILALAQCPADVDLPPVAPGGYTGASVAIDGDLAVIGAPLGTGNDWATGVVLVYRNIDGTWTREAQLAADDGLVGNMMGVSVDVSGDRVVAGAWFEDSLGTDSGAAYVFVHVEGTWTQEAKLKAADAGANDIFGRTVAIDGSTIVVGAPLVFYRWPRARCRTLAFAALRAVSPCRRFLLRLVRAALVLDRRRLRSLIAFLLIGRRRTLVSRRQPLVRCRTLVLV